MPRSTPAHHLPALHRQRLASSLKQLRPGFAAYIWLAAGMLVASLAFVSGCQSGVRPGLAVCGGVTGVLAAGGLLVALLQKLRRVRDRSLQMDRDLMRELQLRRAAEHTALRRDAEFATLFRASADPLIVLHADAADRLAFERLNLAAEQLLGCGNAEAQGRTVAELLPPAAAAALEARARRSLVGQDVVKYLDTLDLPSGRVDLEITLTPIRDADGGVRSLLAATSNVTERNRQEMQVQQQRAEIIGQITAGLAHDFNNLLQSQMGSLEMLLDGDGMDPPQRELAEIALAAAGRGAQLTHHLLAFSRKQVLQPRAVAVGTFLSDLGGILPRLLGPEVELRVTPTLGVGDLYADPAELEAALLNLAYNARDAMVGGGRMRIEASTATAPDAGAPAGLIAGDYVVVSVSDSGSGMDRETLARACEPFFTTKGVRGSGLGLSMVQGFARQSGGELTLLSLPGQGTSAEIWLPGVRLALPDAVDPATPSAVAPRPRDTRILLVDGATNALGGTGDMLERAGYTVLRAACSDSALSLLNGNVAVDLLVTDHAMPGLRGNALIAKTRRMRPDLPAVLIGMADEYPGKNGPDRQVRRLSPDFAQDDLLSLVTELTPQPAHSTEVMPAI